MDSQLIKIIKQIAPTPRHALPSSTTSTNVLSVLHAHRKTATPADLRKTVLKNVSTRPPIIPYDVINELFIVLEDNSFADVISLYSLPPPALRHPMCCPQALEKLAVNRQSLIVLR
jgi:hypothetical protein